MPKPDSPIPIVNIMPHLIRLFMCFSDIWFPMNAIIVVKLEKKRGVKFKRRASF